jgi:hypothetical protein
MAMFDVSDEFRASLSRDLPAWRGRRIRTSEEGRCACLKRAEGCLRYRKVARRGVLRRFEMRGHRQGDRYRQDQRVRERNERTERALVTLPRRQLVGWDERRHRSCRIGRSVLGRRYDMLEMHVATGQCELQRHCEQRDARTLLNPRAQPTHVDTPFSLGLFPR